MLDTKNAAQALLNPLPGPPNAESAVELPGQPLIGLDAAAVALFFDPQRLRPTPEERVLLGVVPRVLGHGITLPHHSCFIKLYFRLVMVERGRFDEPASGCRRETGTVLPGPGS